MGLFILLLMKSAGEYTALFVRRVGQVVMQSRLKNIMCAVFRNTAGVAANGIREYAVLFVHKSARTANGIREYAVLFVRKSARTVNGIREYAVLFVHKSARTVNGIREYAVLFVGKGARVVLLTSRAWARIHRAGVTVAPLVVLLTVMASITVVGTPLLYAERAEATFAGGCFWCMQSPFEKIPGVVDTDVGYSGGTTVDPTYKEVTYEDTGHLEVVHVVYDDDTVSYAELLDVFWKNIDPYDAHGQFCDRGASYQSAIFYHTDEQKSIAMQSKEQVNTVHRNDIVTPLVQFEVFYKGEEYHQDYHIKNPLRYKLYRAGCRRDQRLMALWGRQP